jgi:Myb/SANT-like DNA-binding domain
MAAQQPQQPFEWTYDATLYLIRLRRYYHDYFNIALHNRLRHIWTTIANTIQTNLNFAATEEQCRTKWYSLKYGYENLRRLHGLNPHNQPISNPTMHDRRFYQELSDEFWLRAGN